MDRWMDRQWNENLELDQKKISPLLVPFTQIRATREPVCCSDNATDDAAGSLQSGAPVEAD